MYYILISIYKTGIYDLSNSLIKRTEINSFLQRECYGLITTINHLQVIL